MLADALQRAEVERSAVAEESAQQARSTQTHGERLITVVADAAAGRTAADLDRLAADGVRSAADRQRLAADDAMGVVDQLLRTAEIAGHDRAALLREAVAARDFRNARSSAQVLQGLLDSALGGQRTPNCDQLRRPHPARAVRGPQRLLSNRADAADTRRRELGAETSARVSGIALLVSGRAPARPHHRRWYRFPPWRLPHPLPHVSRISTANHRRAPI